MKTSKLNFEWLCNRKTMAVLACLFLASGVSVEAKEKAPKNAPVFTNFVYQGDDKIYKENPLQPGEF